MICKQEVRGSNPLGSTSQNPPVLIMDGGVRAINVQLDRRDQRAGRTVVVGPRCLDPGVKTAALRAAVGRPLRPALRACGVGAGPSGRAGRAARRGSITSAIQGLASGPAPPQIRSLRQRPTTSRCHFPIRRLEC